MNLQEFLSSEDPEVQYKIQNEEQDAYDKQIDYTDNKHQLQSGDGKKRYHRRSRNKIRQIFFLHFIILSPYIIILMFRFIGVCPIVTFQVCIFSTTFVLPFSYILYSSYHHWEKLVKQRFFRVKIGLMSIGGVFIFSIILTGLILVIYTFIFKPRQNDIQKNERLQSDKITIYQTIWTFIIYILIVPFLSTFTWKIVLPHGLSSYLKYKIADSSFYKSSSQSNLSISLIKSNKNYSQQNIQLFVSIYLVLSQFGYKLLFILLYIENVGLIIILVIIKLIMISTLQIVRPAGLILVVTLRMGVNISLSVFLYYLFLYQ